MHTLVTALTSSFFNDRSPSSLLFAIFKSCDLYQFILCKSKFDWVKETRCPMNDSDFNKLGQKF